jgi:hypothetical protein
VLGHVAGAVDERTDKETDKNLLEFQSEVELVLELGEKYCGFSG